MPCTRDSPSYSHYSDEHMEYYAAPTTSSLTAFPTSAPPGFTPYSSMGRMDPEFLDDESSQEGVEEDERPTIARGRATRILGFLPHEGQYGTIISVRLVFRQDFVAPNKVAFRIKMGNVPLITSIFGVLPTRNSGGHYEIQVVAPDPVQLNINGLKVPLIVQVLRTKDAQIIDDVCIGGFKFIPPPDSSANLSVLEAPPTSLVHHTTDDSFIPSTQESAQTTDHPTGSYVPKRKRARLSIEIRSRDVPSDIESASPDQPSPMLARHLSSRLSQKPGEYAYRAALGIQGNLESMTGGWSDEENKESRRLVEFFSTQYHGNIEVKFAPVHGAATLDAKRNIVSCIWWEDAGEFVITSVDTIGLLQKLVGAKFTTEEKNRIRRNLQGFKPSTISKSQPEHESFFRTLMEFPAPRPRNIEKDVKTFPWSKLPEMLQKIISKYWFIVSFPGSESNEDPDSKHVRVVRDPEGLLGEPVIVGPPLLATNSQHHSDTDTPSRPSGILLPSGYVSSTSTTSGDKSPGQPKTIEDKIYPTGLGNANHINLPFYTNEGIMEISEDTMEAVQSLQTVSDSMVYHTHSDYYGAAFEYSSGTNFYGE